MVQLICITQFVFKYQNDWNKTNVLHKISPPSACSTIFMQSMSLTYRVGNKYRSLLPQTHLLAHYFYHTILICSLNIMIMIVSLQHFLQQANRYTLLYTVNFWRFDDCYLTKKKNLCSSRWGIRLLLKKILSKQSIDYSRVSMKYDPQSINI